MKFIVSQVVCIIAAVSFGVWMKSVPAGVFVAFTVESLYLGIDQITEAIDGM